MNSTETIASATCDASDHGDDDPLIKIIHDPSNMEWDIRKSKLVKHSGFFRRMFSHEFKETRENVVTLHDDNEHAVYWLLSSIHGGEFEGEFMKDILPEMGEHGVTMWADDGSEYILLTYALVLKYDCPDYMHHLVNAFAATFRVFREHFSTEGRTFVKKHLDFVTSHNGGRYPLELAPAIAEAWKYVELWKDEYERLVAAVIEDEPGMAMAVARYYKEKLDRVEDSIEVVKKTIRGANFDT